MANLIPMKRQALDNKVYWCVFDISSNKFSTLTCFGKYKTKDVCEIAIEVNTKLYSL